MLQRTSKVLSYERLIAKLLIIFIIVFFILSEFLNLIFGLITHFMDEQQQVFWHEYSATAFVIVFLFMFIPLLVKYIYYKNRGSAIAEYLNAERIDDKSAIYEEMIALQLNKTTAQQFHLPAAQLYLLADEPAINALTVGFHPDDVTIILTWGAIQSMDKHELQGIFNHCYYKIYQQHYLSHSLTDITFSGLLTVSQLGSYFWNKGIKHKQHHISQFSILYIVLGSIIWLCGCFGLILNRIIRFLLFRYSYNQYEFFLHQPQYQMAFACALQRLVAHQYGSQLYRIDSESLSQYAFANTLTEQSWLTVQQKLNYRAAHIQDDQYTYDLLQKNIWLNYLEKNIRHDEDEENLDHLTDKSLPMLRVLSPYMMNKDAIRPLNPEARQKMMASDILSRALQTPTGCREVIYAVFLIRQYHNHIPAHIDVSQTIISVLQPMDKRIYIQVFYQALQFLTPMPHIIAQQFLDKLHDIIQADDKISLLDCLLMDKIKDNQGLLFPSPPIAYHDIITAIVHLVDAVLHIQSIYHNDYQTIRQELLKNILTEQDYPHYQEICHEPIDLNEVLSLTSGLLMREKLFLLTTLEYYLWHNRAITQEELDTLCLLYWRFGFENDEVEQRLLKQNQLFIS